MIQTDKPAVGECETVEAIRELAASLKPECKACKDIAEIRATLLVNFGEGTRLSKKLGWSVKDEGSTFMMLFNVLDSLTRDA